jgi:NAD(P)-dependent dehydrogenase (short-subunit alcohol dehydrogenase family)
MSFPQPERARLIDLLVGKVVVISGGGGGIGSVIGEAMTEAGARVWILDRDTASGARVASAVGGRFLQVDLSKLESIQSAITKLKAEESCVHVLVNNAGIERAIPLATLDPETWEETIQVNVRAAWYLSQSLLPLLRTAGEASIINIGSIHDEVAYPGNGAYSMSKAALWMFTKVAALEWAPWNIRVNNLCPGAIETAINRGVIQDLGRAFFEERIPLARIGTPRDLVGAALFLASGLSTYVTGSAVIVDGGYSQNLLRYSRNEPD